MSEKRHLHVLGPETATGAEERPRFAQIVLAAVACLVLWLPLGMLGWYGVSLLRVRLPVGTSPAVGMLAIAPLLLSYALASFLSVKVTMRPRQGSGAIGPPLLSALLAALLAVVLASAAGVLDSVREGVLTGTILFFLSVPAVLGAVRFGRRIRP